MSPEAPTLYLPYCQGDYTADGKLKDPDDPYLYWLIPLGNVERHAKLESAAVDDLHKRPTPDAAPKDRLDDIDVGP